MLSMKKFATKEEYLADLVQTIHVHAKSSGYQCISEETLQLAVAEYIKTHSPPNKPGPLSTEDAEKRSASQIERILACKERIESLIEESNVIQGTFGRKQRKL